MMKEEMLFKNGKIESLNVIPEERKADIIFPENIEPLN